jgi:hypothetical protein
MKRWLTEYDIQSHLMLVEDLPSLNFNHRLSNYEIEITKNKNIGYLTFRIIVNCEAYDKARDLSDIYLREFTHLLAFVTNAKFSVHRIIRTIDWTSEVTDRKIYQYQELHEFQPPPSILDNSYIETIKDLLSEGDIDLTIKRALKWFSHGIGSVHLDDKFQYFWFVLELLAEKNKASEAVNDKCPKCHEPLYCNNCKISPTHKPYPKQAIKQHINNFSTNFNEKFFEDADKVRNGIMHGSEIETIEKENHLSVEKILNILGKLAWTAILREFKIKGEKKLSVIQPNKYSHHILQGALELVIPGKTENFGLKDIPQLDFDIIPQIHSSKREEIDPEFDR